MAIPYHELAASPLTLRVASKRSIMVGQDRLCHIAAVAVLLSAHGRSTQLVVALLFAFVGTCSHQDNQALCPCRCGEVLLQAGNGLPHQQARR